MVCHLYLSILQSRVSVFRFRVSDSYSYTYYKPFFGNTTDCISESPRILGTTTKPTRQSPVVQDSEPTVSLLGHSQEPYVYIAFATTM